MAETARTNGQRVELAEAVHFEVGNSCLLWHDRRHAVERRKRRGERSCLGGLRPLCMAIAKSVGSGWAGLGQAGPRAGSIRTQARAPRRPLPVAMALLANSYRQPIGQRRRASRGQRLHPALQGLQVQKALGDRKEIRKA